MSYLYCYEPVCWLIKSLINCTGVWISFSDWVSVSHIYYLNYWFLVPEISFVLLIFIFLIKRQINLKFLLHCILSLFSILFGWFFVISISLWFFPIKFVFAYSYVNDKYSIGIKLILILLMMIYLYVSFYKLSFSGKNNLNSNFEYYRIFFICILFFCLFLFFFISVYDLFGFYLMLEGISFLLITFFILNIEHKIYILSAVRYFCLNAFASGCLLFSIAIFYGVCGTTNLFYIPDFSENIAIVPNSLVLFLIFFSVGCLFKLGCFPFSAWVVSIYRNSSYEILFIFGIIFKTIFFFVWFRFFTFGLSFLSGVWSSMFFYLGVFSIIVGTIGAFNQKQIKPFFAYSSINQSGFLVLGISLSDLTAFHATFLYNFSYLFSLTIIFIVFILIQTNTKENSVFALSDLFILKNDMTLAVTVSLSILSMAGFPPTFGFFAKVFFFQTLILHNYEILCAFLLLLNLVSLYYYLNIIKNIWFFSKDKFTGVINFDMVHSNWIIMGIFWVHNLFVLMFIFIHGPISFLFWVLALFGSSSVFFQSTFFDWLGFFDIYALWGLRYTFSEDFDEPVIRLPEYTYDLDVLDYTTMLPDNEIILVTSFCSLGMFLCLVGLYQVNK